MTTKAGPNEVQNGNINGSFVTHLECSRTGEHYPAITLS